LFTTHRRALGSIRWRVRSPSYRANRWTLIELPEQARTRLPTSAHARPVVVRLTVGPDGVKRELPRLTRTDPIACAAFGLVVRTVVEIDLAAAGIPGRDPHLVDLSADADYAYAGSRRAGRGILGSFHRGDRPSQPKRNTRNKAYHKTPPSLLH